MILAWLFLGMATNTYYLHTKNKEYMAMMVSGELTEIRLAMGIALTIVLWPVAIFNNEFRKK